jgi:HMG-box domain
VSSSSADRGLGNNWDEKEEDDHAEDQKPAAATATVTTTNAVLATAGSSPPLNNDGSLGLLVAETARQRCHEEDVEERSGSNSPHDLRHIWSTTTPQLQPLPPLLLPQHPPRQLLPPPPDFYHHTSRNDLLSELLLRYQFHQQQLDLTRQLLLQASSPDLDHGAGRLQQQQQYHHLLHHQQHQLAQSSHLPPAAVSHQQQQSFSASFQGFHSGQHPPAGLFPASSSLPFGSSSASGHHLDGQQVATVAASATKPDEALFLSHQQDHQRQHPTSSLFGAVPSSFLHLSSQQQDEDQYNSLRRLFNMPEQQNHQHPTPHSSPPPPQLMGELAIPPAAPLSLPSCVDHDTDPRPPKVAKAAPSGRPNSKKTSSPRKGRKRSRSIIGSSGGGLLHGHHRHHDPDNPNNNINNNSSSTSPNGSTSTGTNSSTGGGGTINPNLDGLEKPKRALTAYNYFFRATRAELLQNANKVGFDAMAKEVARRWKLVPANERLSYQQVAVHDRHRYDDEMKVYTRQLQDAKTRFVTQQQASVSHNAIQEYMQRNNNNNHRMKNHPITEQSPAAPQPSLLPLLPPQQQQSHPGATGSCSSSSISSSNNNMQRTMMNNNSANKKKKKKKPPPP